jgi:hypothetical protein
MYDCEVRVRFVEGGEKVWRWVVRSCETLDTGVQREIRCRHCSGAVRVHKQQVEHGPADHVEHVRRHDSENCKGGTYFKGTHRVSDQPVV